MGNRFYDPGEQRASKVQSLFARIAPKYDLINDLQSFGLHRRWKRRTVDTANPVPGDRCLDVCCGTGDLALALAERGCRVTGLDFTEGMLEIARARTHAAGLGTAEDTVGSIHFVRGDAMRLPFPDNVFDIVTVGYGLRNLARWETGLEEMARVTRPGGRVVVLDFGKPANRLWRRLYFGYLRLFVPLLGKMVAGDAQAYAYILESLQHYPAQEGVARRMQDLGLANPGVINLLGGIMSINVGTRPSP